MTANFLCVFCLEHLVPEWAINGSNGRYYYHETTVRRHTLWPVSHGTLGGPHECPAVDFLLGSVGASDTATYCEPAVEQWTAYIRGANAVR